MADRPAPAGRRLAATALLACLWLSITPAAAQFFEEEEQRTEVRLGLGFQNETSSGGTFELSAGGSYLYVEQGTKSVSTTVGRTDSES